MSALPDFIPPSAAKAAKPANEGSQFSEVSTFSSAHPAENDLLENAPLAAKLRAYGRPWPLEIDGEVKCWLVPDDESAKRFDAKEVVYTAEEVMVLSKFCAKGVQDMHRLKQTFGCKIEPGGDDQEE